MQIRATRRTFLKGTAASAAALALGFTAKGVLAKTMEADLTPFVRIDTKGKITAIVKHFEAGQGAATGLTTLIAEELNMDMEKVDYEFAPSNPAVYNNLAFGPRQGTGGSTAMLNSYAQYRKAGAAAREMLLTAAATAWNTSPNRLQMKDGIIKGAGREAPIARFVEAASVLPVPENPTLKPDSELRFIGNASVRRKDSAAKLDGSAIYAMDVQLENQMVAVIKRPPAYGAVLASFNARPAKGVKGFIKAEALPNKAGVVIYAENSWAAMKARERVRVNWDFSNAETRSSDEIYAELQSAVREKPEFLASEVTQAGAEASIADAAQVVEQEFYVPMLAHAPMEPLNCTIEPLSNGGVVLHDGCQPTTAAHMTLARILELPMEKISINTLLAGGSFGRRSSPKSDYHVEAALAFALTDRTRPVKLVWSREDDIKGGFYRPAFIHKAKVGLSADGRILGWDHRIAGSSLFKGTFYEQFAVKNGVDLTSVEGVHPTPYGIPSMHIGLSDAKPATSVNWWRSVGHTHTAFAMETMMDIAARAAGKDPLAFRLAHLPQDNPDARRLAGVLRLAAEKAGWGKPLPAGRARGIAAHMSFRSYVAEVCEISRDAEGYIKVEKVVCGVDCGIAVNPDIVRAQIEGAVGYGLGHAMRNEITLEGGEVVQSNFPDYPPMRIYDIGAIETHIVASKEAPTGIGEPGTPPAPAALANALAEFGISATKMPFARYGVNFA